ncbi:hypothetical protein BC939DRAFT_435485 [Gamsiella multidivaricata]|uniref:uncharacterized protein n=1 Tax=Gamsiella multidivaricata TaxID=101098 RepID=UPI00221F778C|nr:uncharacterized protein BC939DRAFT_435485 [Gamsiella multidivaricata]KAG0360024.1 hypothetical protein BGZ54_009735 [Gamsiella multidivaricata]KAI7832432.1 hypothetical protein BC939DRAFT_435485 [Gamsiella multidivaricata]
MKFLATVAIVASSLAAIATADMLQINNPTQGSTWTTGKSEFVGWTGNCASMGDAGKNVTVDLVTGPASAVRYVATLGTLDCSGSLTRADFTVPDSIATGQYAIIVRTQPQGQESYTNNFQINSGAVAPAPVTPTTTAGATTAAPTATATATNKPSGAGSLGANVMMAFAGAAAVAYQLL